MAIEYLVQHLRPGQIDLGRYDEPKFGIIVPNGMIFVNSAAPKEEQVKTVLHELFHLHPYFFPYTQRVWSNKLAYNEHTEAEIERMAQETYATRPDLVMLIEQRLKEAATHPSSQQ